MKKQSSASARVSSWFGRGRFFFAKLSFKAARQRMRCARSTGGNESKALSNVQLGVPNQSANVPLSRRFPFWGTGRQRLRCQKLGNSDAATGRIRRARERLPRGRVKGAQCRGAGTPASDGGTLGNVGA